MRKEMNIKEVGVRIGIKEDSWSLEKKGFNLVVAKTNVVGHVRSLNTYKNKSGLRGGKAIKLEPKGGIPKRIFKENASTRTISYKYSQWFFMKFK